MDSFFQGLKLADLDQDVFRNIPTIRVSQDLFDDIADSPDDQEIAQAQEMAVKPAHYTDPAIIIRPFEEYSETYYDVIGFPFINVLESRYSKGQFGVWYGSDTVITSTEETLYHWKKFLLETPSIEYASPFIAERSIYLVKLTAALLDFRERVSDYPDLIHKTSYDFTQSIGERIHREGYPGLITPSVRSLNGEIIAAFTPAILDNPRNHCYLTYTADMDNKIVTVERQEAEEIMRKKWDEV